MATDTDELVISISADTRAIRNSLKKLLDDTQTTAKGIETSFNSINVGNKISSNMKAAAQDAKVLSFQINDVATGLLSGGKASQIFAQQAGQISQAFNGRSLSQSVALLGSSLMGMINPINLAIVAFGLATYAAGKYFTDVDDGSEASTKAIAAQKAELDSVVKKWGDLLPALKKVKEAQDALESEGQVRTATQTEIAAGYKTAREEIAKLLPAIQAIQFAMQRPGEDAKAADALGEAYDNLSTKIANGTATAEDLNKVLPILTEYSRKHNGVLDELISRLSKQAAGLDTAATKAQELTKQEKAATEAQLGLNAALQKMSELAQLPITDMEKLLKLYDEAITKALQLDNADARSEAGRAALAGFREGQSRILSGPNGVTESLQLRATNPQIAAAVAKLNDDFAARLKVLLDEFPGAKIASAYRSFEEQQKIYDSGVRPAAKPGMSLHQYGAAADLSGISPSDYARLHSRAKELGINFDVANDPLHAQLTGFKRPGDSQRQANKDLDEWNKKQADAIELQKQANAIRGDTSQSINQQNAAIEENKLYQEGLNAAIAQYGTVTDAQKEAIRATAHEMAQLGLAADDLTTKQKEAAQQQKENAKAWEDFGKQITGIAQSAIGGFVNDLRNGVSAGEAFRNMLDRVVDGLINMAVQSLFSEKALGGVIQSLFSGGSSFFPAAPGGLYHTGGVAGFGTVRRGGISPGVFAGAPRYHSGGVAGLRPGEVPAILQRGELIVPRMAAANNNSSSTSNSITFSVNAGNNANGGDLNAFAQSLNKAVEQKLVAEQRPGGLLNRRR